MLTRENKIRVFFIAGASFFASLLIVVAVILVRDTLSSSNENISSVENTENTISEEDMTASTLELPSSVFEQEMISYTEEVIMDGEEEAFSPPESENTIAGMIPRETLPGRERTLIFVIDDAGNNLRDLEPFLKFPGELTIAVLPALVYSSEAARLIREAGKEVILHQPMEAIGGQNPGPGAIYVGMPPEEIRTILERNLDEIGPVVGLNNHQGSRATTDEVIVEIVLSLSRERGIYFLDSRTSAETIVPQTARRMGIAIEERNIFLDNSQERAYILDRISEGLARADRYGQAIMIGHTWSPRLADILTEVYPDLINQGYTVSTISRLRDRE